MRYTAIMQETKDLDWFAIDKCGYIAHFASAGGRLPVSVADSKENNEILTSFCRNLPVVNSRIVVNDLVVNTKEFPSEESKRWFLKDCIFMSQRGLYSFDKEVLANFSHTNFQLITSPLSPLHISELPDEIQQLLSKTKMEEELTRIYEIDVSHIL